MRYTASPTRPAIAAIAAVLALQTFSASVQTIDPAAAPDDPAPAPTVLAPPVIAPAQSAPAPSPSAPQVIYQSNGPVVQPVPVTPAPVQVVTPSTTPVAPKEAISSPSPAPKAAAVKEAKALAAVAPLPRALEAAPAEPIDALPMQAAPKAPAVAAVVPDDGTEAGYWILGLGAALLVGAGSYAALRRRQVSAVAELEKTMFGYKPVIEQEREIEPFVAVNPADRFKATEPELAVAPVAEVTEPDQVSAAISPASSERPIAASTPEISGDLASRREAMIAEAPSTANPFLTRKNRLRRANFLLARNANELVLEQPSTPSVSAQSAKEKPADAIQISYAFGKNSVRPPVLKPRFN